MLLVPRWGGTPASDWYPWLTERLDVPVRGVELRPEPGSPTLAGMQAALSEAIAPAELAHTLLVGHSVGCQAVLRFLGTLPEGPSVRGFVAVAGWFTVDEPWDSIRPWVETPIAPARVPMHVLLSDNDPFTRDHADNASRWEALGARVTTVPGAKHFNGAEEPEVLEAVAQELAGKGFSPAN